MTAPKPRWRAKLWSRILAASATVLVLAPFLAASAVEQDPERPGTPLYTAQGQEFRGLANASNAFSTGTQQWLRLPLQGFYGYVKPRESLPNDPQCRRGQDWAYYNSFEVELYASSPEGSPARYGYFAPATVRAVAFGSIPVEATLQLEQPRDKDGLIDPIEVTAPTYTYCRGEGPHAGPTQDETLNPAPEGGGELIVRITALTVDGVEIAVNDSCRTEETAALELSGKDWYSLDPDLRPGERSSSEWNINTTRFYKAGPGQGGRITGTVNIPGFTGCVANGDDLSPLLTATISGPENALEMVATGPTSEQVCGYELQCAGDPTNPPFPTRD